MARRLQPCIGAAWLLAATIQAQAPPTLRRIGTFDVGPGGNVCNLAFSDDGKPG